MQFPLALSTKQFLIPIDFLLHSFTRIGHRWVDHDEQRHPQQHLAKVTHHTADDEADSPPLDVAFSWQINIITAAPDRISVRRKMQAEQSSERRCCVKDLWSPPNLATLAEG